MCERDDPVIINLSGQTASRRADEGFVSCDRELKPLPQTGDTVGTVEYVGLSCQPPAEKQTSPLFVLQLKAESVQVIQDLHT